MSLIGNFFSGLGLYNLLILSILVYISFILLKRYVWSVDGDVRYSQCEPPGPWGLPVLGNLLQLGSSPHKSLTKMWTKYGNVFKIQMGSRPTVVLNGLETIRQALVRQYEDFSGRPDFYTFNFIGKGISMGFGDYTPRWRTHRRIAQNALAMMLNSRDNPMHIFIEAEAEVLVGNLIDQGKGNTPIDPHNEIYLSVGNIICAMCFGKRYQRDDPDFQQLIKNNDDFMSFAAAGNPVDIMPWLKHFPNPPLKNFLGILDTMNKFCDRKTDEHLSTYDSSYLRDITDALIHFVKETPREEKEAVGLTDDHILTTVQEMIGAGFDTIATTLQWSILFMATNPEFQKQMQAEIDSVIGKDRYPSYNDYENLPFTEACILETMRHSCIFPFALPHSSTRDSILNGHFIAERTLIFINMWSVNRDPANFPNPEKYDPYRFYDEATKTVDRVMAEKFIPFGMGRRRCPGEQLAKMELCIFFSTLYQRCSFATVPGMTYEYESKYGLTLKPKDFVVSVEKRT
ncbi:unnamed protein product [Owenia fusiformis]|uniref:unspecific monooxygenase n=1 Tax=Owenia fusiformis TaxID=6347 RepID=A0A8J1Y8A6_OWEFU|nr:unnamed protein product [Owenia fusiformis]